MTGPTGALVLFPVAAALLAVGGLLTWPVARRVGERHPDRLYWAPVSNPHDSARRWRAITPPPPRRTVRDWWASTAPRDVHAAVRSAMNGGAHRSSSWRGAR